MKRYPVIAALCASLAIAMTQPSAAQKVVIKGSNTFGEELGPAMIQSYQAAYPESEVELESKGSGTGFAALLEGNCDIAAASRPANEDEIRLAKSRGIKMKMYTVGYYGVAVIVHEDNALSGMSDDEVRDVFTGLVTNWKQVGGEDRDITLYIRDPVSGTYLGFQELAMARKPYPTEAVQHRSYAEIAEAVAKDKSAIGYVGMHAARRPGIRTIMINGMPPSFMSVNEGFYPYARLLRFYTSARNESKETKRFVRFVQRKRGQEVLENMGFVPRMKQRFDPAFGLGY